MIKLAAGVNDGKTFVGLGFEPENIRRLVDEPDSPVFVKGDMYGLPNTGFLFYAAETYDGLMSKIDAAFRKATGKKHQKLSAVAIGDKAILIPFSSPKVTTTLLFVCMYGKQVEEFRRGRTIGFDLVAEGKAVNVFMFYTTSKKKTETELMAAGLISPSTNVVREDRSDSTTDYTSRLEKWQASFANPN